MATKLKKSAWPAGHSEGDFKCFGPAAEKDGEFSGTMLADMGCFTQDGKDSNKYYHGAVVQSTKDNVWYAYFEYGRTGGTGGDRQFIKCSSQAEAQSEYEKQMHAKNDKRGRWIQHSTLGKILQAKPGKDCYLVRPQASRSTGLPDAKTISSVKTKVQAKSTDGGSTKVGKIFDRESASLLQDLNVATLQYTRNSMATGAVPTQDAIDEARRILAAAGQPGLKTKEVEELTNLLYSRIPKKKNRGEAWLLDNSARIGFWNDDLDAFESALKNQDTSVVSMEYPFFLEWLPQTDELGKYIRDWTLKATRNRHGHLSNMKIDGLWKVVKQSDYKSLRAYQQQLIDYKIRVAATPLHQPSKRIDIDDAHIPSYQESGTHMLFHGTRSVNVSGILRESLKIRAASAAGMFGKGIYFADDWKKSHGYTSDRGSYYAGGSGGAGRRRAFMFIADVVLGNPKVMQDSDSSLRKAPSGYHSVFGKEGRYLSNNEFIVYREDAVNLHYLIEFHV